MTNQIVEQVIDYVAKKYGYTAKTQEMGSGKKIKFYADSRFVESILVYPNVSAEKVIESFEQEESDSEWCYGAADEESF